MSAQFAESISRNFLGINDGGAYPTLEVIASTRNRPPQWDAKQFEEYWRAQTLREVAGEIKDSTTVIEFNGTPVGRLRIVRPGGEIFIGGIQILPNYQRAGLGSRLVRSMTEEARGQALPLTLEVEKDNPDAKRLYARLGFNVVADLEYQERMELRVTGT